MKKIAFLISTVCLMAACSTGPEEIPTVVEEPATDAVTRAASTIELNCLMEVQFIIQNPYHFAYWEIQDITFVGSDGQTRVVNHTTPGIKWYGYDSALFYSSNSFVWGIRLQSVKIRLTTNALMMDLSPNFFIYVEDGDTYETCVASMDLRGMQNRVVEIDIPTTESWWDSENLRKLNINMFMEVQGSVY
ncbi:MAG: hypothetical protein LUE26_01835 [Alistipes sp.]|nr:hypothetical protein [Alistipes sp.]